VVCHRGAINSRRADGWLAVSASEVDTDLSWKRLKAQNISGSFAFRGEFRTANPEGY